MLDTPSVDFVDSSLGEGASGLRGSPWLPSPFTKLKRPFQFGKEDRGRGCEAVPLAALRSGASPV